jgi:hypothetical protein
LSKRTNRANRNAADGNLTQKFSLDELLNNAMIYWVSGSITSSFRFYAENMSDDYVQVTSFMTISIFITKRLLSGNSNSMLTLNQTNLQQILGTLLKSNLSLTVGQVVVPLWSSG